MRTLMIATAILSLGAASAADAGQRVVQHGPGMGGHMRGNMGGGMMHPSMPRPPMMHGPRPNMGHYPNRPRWGGHVQGKWWGGYRAPGGWNSYRRPTRGWVLPSYWVAPNWYVNDWSGYGLPQPQQGYNWSRYYDDAVLIDGRGSVYDTIGGVDWDQYDADDADYSYRDDYAEDGYRQQGYGQQGYAQPGAGYGYPERRDSGLGGAAIGAVAGGVAGNLIAGRGNRLGGTLIGAGVGAAAGYAIDRSDDRGYEDRGRRGPPPPPPGYGAGYPPPPGGGYGAGGPGYQGGVYQGGVYQGGGTTVVTNGGHHANGYYYPGATVTTITVATQPVVTTTTTEIFEDSVTYSRAPMRKTWRKKVWKPRPKCVCR